jgi:DNA-directed RNA polymerase specialized sigma24 family protein
MGERMTCEWSPFTTKCGLDIRFAGVQQAIRTRWGAVAGDDAVSSAIRRPQLRDGAMQGALTPLARPVGALRAAEAVISWSFVKIRHACLRRLVLHDAVPQAARSDLADDVVDGVVIANAITVLPVLQRDVSVLPAERTAQRSMIVVPTTKSRLHRARRASAASLPQSEPWRSA